MIVAAHAHLAPVALACACVSGAPFVVWGYGLEVWGRLRFVDRFAMQRARSLLAISHFTATRMATAVGMSPESVQIVPLATERERTRALDVALDSGTRASGPARVLTVARLDRSDRYKGVDTLIIAWPQVLRSLSDAELLVVGDGDDRSRLEQLARQFAVENRVRFLGRVDDARLRQLYGEARLFALPGRLEEEPRPAGEGLGLVFLEAAAAGLASVAGRAAGATEAVEHGVTGLLADPLDPGDVAAMITRLLQEPATAARMGRAGQERVHREFSFERFRESVCRIIEDLCKANSATPD